MRNSEFVRPISLLPNWATGQQLTFRIDLRPLYWDRDLCVCTKRVSEMDKLINSTKFIAAILFDSKLDHSHSTKPMANVCASVRTLAPPTHANVGSLLVGRVFYYRTDHEAFLSTFLEFHLKRRLYPTNAFPKAHKSAILTSTDASNRDCVSILQELSLLASF